MDFNPELEDARVEKTFSQRKLVSQGQKWDLFEQKNSHNRLCDERRTISKYRKRVRWKYL